MSNSPRQARQARPEAGPAPVSHAIPLDMTVLRGLDAGLAQRQITRIVRSTRTELDAGEGTLRLLGPDTGYHAADARLAELLATFEPGMQLPEIAGYRSSRPWFDLCLEDSWTGFFVARGLGGLAPGDDLILVHLDDHTDMMSTMLVVDGPRFIDPARAAPFRPDSPADWDASIRSGCIGIGSFVTALLLLDRQVHVRHLNNSRDAGHDLLDVVPDPVAYPLLPGKRFAATRNVTPGGGARLGTCLGGSDASQVLRSVPSGHIIVHIDLDYFINDFNGNVGSLPTLSLPEQRAVAQRKMAAFFQVLGAELPRVDHWIIATSPGFCSIIHWHWLLAGLEERIRAFGAARQSAGR